MPAECYFSLNSRSISMLTCKGFGNVPAFSGLPAYANNPADTGILKAGPLPTGLYYIVNRQSGGHFGWLYDVIKDKWSGVDHSTWFALYRNDGVIDDWTYINGIKRGQFRLHPNGRHGLSEGCITVHDQSQFDRLRTFLPSQPPQTVPGTAVKYYGTVLVQ
ncbi:hypothetical protein BZM27_36160 [Paraburkholderia steynii]|uniref:Tlde1 domain-containing protein n=1 Tax=Paraburkholderia steynii TaxID=1245441 RepID=A0A4R0X4M9_9BURK|nr:hypothetical protein BZM27_36160 [Paraburkholderia steynii]